MRRQLTMAEVMACVVLALGVAFWMWHDGEKKGGIAAVGNSPQVTKPYPRERDERERRTKNPREEFDAARKRGLTEEEVRVVVEDFQQALAYEDGAGLPVEVMMRELREKRLGLYFDMLAEGFHLSKKQKLDAQSKLPSLAAKDVNQCLLLETVDRAWALSPSSGLRAGDKTPAADPDMTRSEMIEVMASYPIRLRDQGVRPWELCELDDRQKELIGHSDDSGQWIWVDGGERTLDFGTTECYADLSDPFSEEGVMAIAGEVFPLSMWQVERLGDYEDESVSPHTPKVKDGGLLDRVQFLTRPQLMTLLLSDSKMAGDLKRELAEAADRK